MRIGIAYDLRSDFASGEGLPDDALEEYDSEETVEAIARALRAAGHEPVRMGGGPRFIERALAERGRLDLVFNIAEGRGSRSREAHVPAACEMLGIPFTHSDPLALALALDKPLSKRVVASHGLPTAPFATIEREEDLEGGVRGETSLSPPGWGASIPPFPVIAKPAWEGSSIGVRRSSRCDDRAALAAQVARLLRDYRQPVLVEQFLTGAELTAGVLGSGRAARVIGVMEIAPRRGPRDGFIYSLEVKRNWEEEVEYHVPPRIPAPLRREVERLALRCTAALGCRDVARVDLRVDAFGAPCVIEVNPLPGLNPKTGDLPILAARSGLPYEALIARIVEHALERQPAQQLAAAAP